MKFFIKNEFINNKPGFTIYDSLEKKKYLVLIEHKSLGMKLDVCNINVKRFAKIRQHGASFNKTYNINADRKKIKLIVRVEENQIKVFLKGISWTLDGDFSKKDFAVFDEQKIKIMVHKRKSNSNAAYYQVDINDCNYELLCLSIALCIDTLLLSEETESEKGKAFSLNSIFEDKKVLRGLKDFSSGNDLDTKIKKDLD